jgi:hypothetical protein
MKNKIDSKIIICGIIALVIIEAMALWNGIDGILLTTIVGIIALVIGVAIPKEKIFK